MEERARIPVGLPVANPVPSYWHNPKSPLAKLIEPETENPTEPYDYAIIGSGISGTTIAHNLLIGHPKARIVMLEGRETCSGATGRNGGHTKAASYRSYMQHVQELGKEEALKIARLEYANIIDTHRLAEELSIGCENLLCDTLDVIYDQATFELGKVAIQALRADAKDEEKEIGKMAWYQVYEKEESLEQDFYVAPSVDQVMAEEEELAGVFKYRAGRIHAYRFTTGLLKECVKKGLQLCTRTPVHDIRASTRSTVDGTPMWDVSTQRNTITAQHVILATNGYTSYLLKDLQGAIVPMRGQITAQRPGKRAKLPNPLPTTYSFIYQTGYEYMIPRSLPDGGQHLIIGGGLGRLPDAGACEYGAVDDSSLNSEISTYLRGSLIGYFGAENWGETPEEAPERVIQEWTGIMGATADGRPFVGQVPGKKGLWVSAGFNGHGMVLCLKSAEALVRMIEGGGHEGKPEWFPESFLITEERVRKGMFCGRTDMQTLT